MAAPLALLQGTLDVLILKTLSWQPMHGYAVSRWIRARSDDALLVEDAALYQALHRLEARGLTQAEWGVTANNQRARYYRLTPAGRAHLGAETAQWVRYAETVTGILTAAPRPA